MRLLNAPLRRLWSVGGLTLLFLGYAHPQAVPLTKGEFDLAVARMQTVTIGVPHRSTEKVEEFAEGKLVKTTDTVREFDASDNYRVVRKVRNGDDYLMTESIWIGSIEYVRTNNGKWGKTDWSRGGTGDSGSGPEDEGKFSVEERRDGPILTRLFTSERTYILNRGKKISVTRYFTNQFYWRVKIERTESMDEPGNVVKQSVTDFNYDIGKIEIAAPIR